MRLDCDDLQSYGSLELTDGKNLLAFQDICHSPREAQRGSYNTLCRVKVVSGEFAGAGEWECDWKDLLRFAEELEQLYLFQQREVKFEDIEWGNWLEFTINKTGQILISGFLYGTDAGAHTLKFEFRTDQTYLKPFLQQLKRLSNGN